MKTEEELFNDFMDAVFDLANELETIKEELMGTEGFEDLTEVEKNFLEKLYVWTNSIEE